MNRTLRSMLAKHCKKFGPQWDIHLQQLLLAYRMKPHESTGESPFFLVYGRDARLPTESVLDNPPSPYTVDSEEYQIELARSLSSAWEIARFEIGKAQRRQKHQYDKKAKRVDFREGMRVMVYMPQETTGKKRKLALPYHGPYRIVEVWPNCLLVHLVDRPADRGSNSGEHGQSGEVLRRTPRCLVERRGKATVSQEEEEAKGQEPQESQIRVEEHFVYLFPRT